MSKSQKTLRAKALFEQYACALRGLKKLGLVRSANSPISDYAEWLVAKTYRGRMSTASSKGVDVVAGRHKLQVKARWMAKGKKDSRLLGAIRSLKERAFTHIAAILFGPQFEIQEAYLIPYSVVDKIARYSTHVNAHRLNLSRKVCSDRRVCDISDRVRASAHR